MATLFLCKNILKNCTKVVDNYTDVVYYNNIRNRKQAKSKEKSKMKKEIKVEWCKNWIKKTFEKLPKGITGIYTDLFWELAEKSGLWVKGTYGTSMSQALEELTMVDGIKNLDRNVNYYVFRLK